jgi:hypothetical protein
MNEKTKAGIEAAIELFKGWIRPLVVLGMTAVICVMTVEGRLSEIDWQFWAVYAGFASVWLGEGTINKIMQVKK